MQILITEQVNGDGKTFLVTRGRTTVACEPDMDTARTQASRAYQDGDTVSTVSKDGAIVNITRSITRSLTRTRSRAPRVRGRQ